MAFMNYPRIIHMASFDKRGKYAGKSICGIREDDRKHGILVASFPARVTCKKCVYQLVHRKDGDIS